MFCDLSFDVYLDVVYYLEFDDFNALRKVRCPSPSITTYVGAHLLLDQCNRRLRGLLDQSIIWNYFARRLVSQGIPLPYGDLETDKDLSTQDLRRIVWEAFRREKAWSQPYATPVAVRIHREAGRCRMNELAKVITSDLVAIIDGWRLKFLRLSDFFSVDVYEFPRGNLSFDDYFELYSWSSYLWIRVVASSS